MGGEMRQTAGIRLRSKLNYYSELADNALLTAISYIDSGNRVVTTHGDGIVRIIDLTTKREESFSIHRDYVSSFVIDPQERFGLSIDRFGDLKLWFLNPMDIIGSLRYEDRTKMRAQFRGQNSGFPRMANRLALRFLSQVEFRSASGITKELLRVVASIHCVEARMRRCQGISA